VFAGFFLYLGAAHLLPEAHRSNSGIPVILSTLAGFAILLGVSLCLKTG